MQCFSFWREIQITFLQRPNAIIFLYSKVMPRQRHRILRERNERGLSLFLRTLNSVLRIFISEDPFKNVCRNDSIDVQERLIDASSTLALLVEDMSISNRAEIDGLNVNLRGRLIDLKKNV